MVLQCSINIQYYPKLVCYYVYYDVQLSVDFKSLIISFILYSGDNL